MIIVCRPEVAEEDVGEIVLAVESAGLVAHRSDGVDRTIVGVVGDRSLLDRAALSMMPGVRDIVDVSAPYKLASREFRQADTVVHVGDAPLGGNEVVVVACCAVESESQVEAVARGAVCAGSRVLRAGAPAGHGPRLARRALDATELGWLRAAADRHGLAVVSEVATPEEIPLVAAHADALLMRAGDMHGAALLSAVGRAGKPVLLERGFAATVQEWLLAAEHILSEGNPDVVLCEGGIRTFETATPGTLDLSAVAVVEHLSHLPILVDPSRGTGDRRWVEAMARAAVAAGADGIAIEVHPCPRRAQTDGRRSLDLQELAALTRRCRVIAAVLGRPMARERAA